MFFFYAEKEVNLLLKGEEKMQKKTMISISERENVVSLRTYSRDHQCSNNFCFTHIHSQTGKCNVFI